MPRAFALVAAAAALGLVPAAARAATMGPLKPCYVSAGEEEREPVLIAARGLTPNGTVSVRIDGTVVIPNVLVGPDGSIAGGRQAPFQPSGQRLFTLTLTENENLANTVSAQSLVTALDVKVIPRDARPSSRVLFRGRGFTQGAEVYAHYVYRGRLRRTVRLASSAGPCGTFEVRRRQLPVRRPRTGRWTLQLDQDPTWREQPTTIHFSFTIDVHRTFGRPPS